MKTQDHIWENKALEAACGVTLVAPVRLCPGLSDHLRSRAACLLHWPVSGDTTKPGETSPGPSAQLTQSLHFLLLCGRFSH